LFYIRKDYNLIWSVVTDIGDKHTTRVSKKAAKFMSSPRAIALAVGTTSYIEGNYRTILDSMFILMVYISC
jgi:hypothetical protein